MHIREASSADIADTADIVALAALSTQLGYPSTPEQTRERLTALAERPANAVLVAEEDGTIIGWLHVCGMLFLESPPFAEVAGLVVHEAHRGKGAGKLLLDAAARWATERGFDRLRVRSNVVREDAHRFYEREGFERTKAQVVLDRRLGRR